MIKMVNVTDTFDPRKYNRYSVGEHELGYTMYNHETNVSMFIQTIDSIGAYGWNGILDDHDRVEHTEFVELENLGSWDNVIEKVNDLIDEIFRKGQGDEN
jgi:hypothetical protein